MSQLFIRVTQHFPKATNKFVNSSISAHSHGFTLHSPNLLCPQLHTWQSASYPAAECPPRLASSSAQGTTLADNVTLLRVQINRRHTIDMQGKGQPLLTLPNGTRTSGSSYEMVSFTAHDDGDFL